MGTPASELAESKRQNEGMAEAEAIGHADDFSVALPATPPVGYAKHILALRKAALSAKPGRFAET